MKMGGRETERELRLKQLLEVGRASSPLRNVDGLGMPSYLGE